MAVEKNLQSGSAKCKQRVLKCDNKLHQGVITRAFAMSKGHFECKECEKHFGSHHLLKLHLQVHHANNENACVTVMEEAEASDSPLRLPATPMTSEENHTASSVSHETGVTQGSLPVSGKKVAGLTKVRLEDCLRCDACSCIYLDEADYHKHMRNFHHKMPKKSKAGHGKKCRSCCKNCKCSKTSSRQTCITQLADVCRLPYDIKDRWKKLMNCAVKKIEIPEFPVKVKLEPDDTYDYSHLLSQVEVNIKTEPDC